MTSLMKIAFITAGAAGMYCGSCLRDNALARALVAKGHEVILVPTYTPTRTDEPNQSIHRVFLGGINLYLQHKSALFRHTPWATDRVLDSPTLLNWVSRFAVKTDAADLGALTVSMLQGETGPDRKEFRKLANWLREEVRPDIVDLSNSMLIGLAATLRSELGVPVVCSLSGEDLFLEGLPKPWHGQALDLLRRRAMDVNGFITFSHSYANFMKEYLQIGADRLHQVPLGISLEGYDDSDDTPASAGEVSVDQQESQRFRIGYLARICPEKGLHLLLEAFRDLRTDPRFGGASLQVAGYLGARDRRYWRELCRQVEDWGLTGSVEFAGELDRAAKIRFLRALDVFSVPTVYREAKGLPVLEAWASRVPVVQPWHGSFTELVNATQGGLLVPPNDPKALADAIGQLLENPGLRKELGQRGRQAVERQFTAEHMATSTLSVYTNVLREHTAGNK